MTVHSGGPPTGGGDQELIVTFADEVWHLTPGEELTFGREADIEIDTNRHLHRRLGRFRHHEGGWWLANVGSAIAIEVCDEASPSHLTISPGASAPMPFANSQVRFRAGTAAYELTTTTRLLPGPVPDAESLAGSETITATNVTLNDEQRLLLLALAERRLLDRSAPHTDIPPNKQVADRLGWAMTKFNRKLDNLCARFDRLGVVGLKGDVAGLASNRRERLVDHVITAGLLRPDDLALLRAHDQR